MSFIHHHRLVMTNLTIVAMANEKQQKKKSLHYTIMPYKIMSSDLSLTHNLSPLFMQFVVKRKFT